MSQNHFAGALTEGHAHNVVLLSYLRSRTAEPLSSVESEPEPTPVASKRCDHRCSCGEPIGYVRGFPIYCSA